MRFSIGTSFGPWRMFRLSQTLWRSNSRRPAADYWIHSGCSVHHRTEGAANRCRYGNRVTPRS
jgi:hypothetical protein